MKQDTNNKKKNTIKAGEVVEVTCYKNKAIYCKRLALLLKPLAEGDEQIKTTMSIDQDTRDFINIKDKKAKETYGRMEVKVVRGKKKAQYFERLVELYAKEDNK